MGRMGWVLCLLVFSFAWAQTFSEWEQRGDQQMNQGDYQGAVVSYSRALELLQTQLKPDDLLIAEAHNKLGLGYYLLNLYAKALDQFEKAAAIYKDRPEVGGVYLQMGEVYSAQDNYPKALESYRKARDSFEKNFGLDSPLVGSVLIKTSLLFVRLHNLEQAQQDAQEAVRIYEMTAQKYGYGFATGQAQAYEQLGYVFRNKQMPEEELNYLLQSLELKKQALGMQHPATADVLREIGDSYLKLGKLTEALQYSELALQVFTQLYGASHPVTAQLYMSLSDIHLAQKDYAAALESLGRVQQIFTQSFGLESIGVSLIYQKQAAIYEASSDFGRALEAHQKNLALAKVIFGQNNINTAIAYGAVGSIYSRTDRPAQALGYYQQAFDISFGQQNLAFQVLDNSGKLEYKSRNANFVFATIRSLTRTKAATLGRKQQVLNNWLSSKGSAFAFENGLALLQDQANPALKQQILSYLEQRQQLALLYTRTPEDSARARALQVEIEDQSREVGLLENRLSTQMQSFANLLALQRIRWPEVSSLLEPRELYIDFAWSDRDVFVLTLDYAGSVDVFRLGNVQDIEALVKTLRSGIEAGKTLQQIAPASRALYQTLLAPLESSLGRAKSLIISPDGPLAFLPFDLLSDGKQLLLDRFVIRYIPSARDLIRLNLNAALETDSPAAVFGNPAFSSTQGSAQGRGEDFYSLADLLRKTNFAALPGTANEAREVAALLGDKTNVFLGEAANQNNLFSLKSPRVLHLATHGFFVNDPTIPNPLLRVGIALAGAKASVVAGEDYGLLTALQLSSLKLAGTELVVLSACETGMGDAVAGEGVAGLNQAFLTAGAKRVMLSLWKVPDQETAALMEGFYREWVSGKTEAEALQRAKLALRDKGLVPLDWAAFLLNG